MNNRETIYPVSGKSRATWLRTIVLALVIEKIIQHLFVTTAFTFNWADIGSTVVVNPRLLMILGAIVALLFAISLWGLLRWTRWAINLVIALALFDIVGEFIAQGKLAITVTISILVAILLLVLALFLRRQELKLDA